MRIEFTGRREVVAAARVAFEANVDGADVWCSVSLDALNDHFGNDGPSAHDLVGTFEANRARIENATRRVLEKNGGNPWNSKPGISTEARGFRSRLKPLDTDWLRAFIRQGPASVLRRNRMSGPLTRWAAPSGDFSRSQQQSLRRAAIIF